MKSLSEAIVIVGWMAFTWFCCYDSGHWYFGAWVVVSLLAVAWLSSKRE